MKKSLLILLVLILALMVAAPIPVLAQDDNPPTGSTITGDQVVIGNTFRLASGDTLDGSMLIIGGTATTANGSEINGDLVLIGGTLGIDGSVNGNIVSIGGAVNLGDSAIINGNLSMLGANLQRSSGAVINGTIEEESPNFIGEEAANQRMRWIPFSDWRDPLRGLLTTIFEALAMGVLAVLVGLLLPHNVKNIAANVVCEPLVSGGIGLLTIIVAPIMLLLLAITIILIPVSLVAFIRPGSCPAPGIHRCRLRSRSTTCHTVQNHLAPVNLCRCRYPFTQPGNRYRGSDPVYGMGNWLYRGNRRAWRSDHQPGWFREVC